MYCNFCGAALQVGVAQCPSCGSPTPYGAQQPGQNIQPLPPQQPGARQAATSSNAAPPHKKLSDYKSTGLSGGQQAPTAPPSSAGGYNSAPLPGIAPGAKLSLYGQAATQPGKLSDYKQPSVQRSKLSDYNVNPHPEATGTANYQAFLSSIPTAGPGTFSATPPPTPGPFPSPATTPATPHPTGIQPVYPQAASMASMPPMSTTSNPPSLIPTADGYASYSSPQAGAPPTHTAQPGKQRGLLIGGGAVILLIVCIGSLFFLQTANKNNDNYQTVATKAAVPALPTVAPIHGPSGNTSVSAVAMLFSEPQMTTGIDSSDKATQPTHTFTSGQTIYVTFSLHSKSQKGYVQARWYKGKQLFHEVELAHDPSKTNGYFSIVYDAPTTDGSVELYWSTTASFSAARLARVAHFSVTH